MSIIEVNWRPGKRELRQFSAAWLAFFGILGAIRVWHEPASTTGILFCLVASIGLVGLAFPTALRPLYVVATAVALPIGWVVSHILLGIVFFVAFTLIGLMLRLAGYDPLTRKLDRSAKTYWKPRSRQPESDEYFRQF